jgi:hypothetical protein
MIEALSTKRTKHTKIGTAITSCPLRPLWFNCFQLE